MTDRPEPPRPLVAACVVIGIEALALIVLAILLVVDSITSRSVHGLLSAAFALLGAAALGFGARGLLRLSQAARTPVLVLQLLALPVAYTIAFPAHRPGLGGPILVAAIVVIYLLFTPPVREIMDRAPRD